VAKVIPASWPEPLAAVDYATHTVHTDADTQTIVESHNYELAHYVRGHVGQTWPVGVVQDATGVATAVLRYPLTPRGLVTQLRISALLHATNAGTLTIVDLTAPGSSVAIAVPAAVAPAYSAVTGVLTLVGSAATTIEVRLTAASGADTIVLRSLSITDESLAVLP